MGREVAGDFWQNKGQICWKNTNIAIDIAKKILTNIDIYIDINIAKTNFKKISKSLSLRKSLGNYIDIFLISTSIRKFCKMLY